MYLSIPLTCISVVVCVHTYSTPLTCPSPVTCPSLTVYTYIFHVSLPTPTHRSFLHASFPLTYIPPSYMYPLTHVSIPPLTHQCSCECSYTHIPHPHTYPSPSHISPSHIHVYMYDSISYQSAYPQCMWWFMEVHIKMHIPSKINVGQAFQTKLMQARHSRHA